MSTKNAEKEQLIEHTITDLLTCDVRSTDGKFHRVIYSEAKKKIEFILLRLAIFKHSYLNYNW